MSDEKKAEALELLTGAWVDGYRACAANVLHTAAELLELPAELDHVRLSAFLEAIRRHAEMIGSPESLEQLNARARGKAWP